MAAARVLLKLSGEALGSEQYSIDVDRLNQFSADIAFAAKQGVQVGVVIGGGNFIRGASCSFARPPIKRVTADQMAMLSTIMNALALRDVLEAQGLPTEVLSALPISGIARGMDVVLARRWLSKGRVVIFAGGTGNPLVTTDTTASLRGVEIEASILLKATKVDGVYDKDPQQYPEAKRYEELSFEEALQKELAIMDLSAFHQCRDFKLPIRVFNIFKPGALRSALLGKSEGTLIRGNL